MPTYYFDYHDNDGVFVDHHGEEMPDVEAARKEALRALGDAVQDLVRSGTNGRIVIEVRDGAGISLRVSATFETILIKK
jgi:hypothetical protein